VGIAHRAAGAACAAALTGIALAAAADPRGAATVTIYQPAGAPGQVTVVGGAGYGGAALHGAPLAPGGSFALVVEKRPVDLVAGDNVVRVRGVAARLDPTTVQFASETDRAHTVVVEQRFAYDLSSPDAMLERSVGREVVLVTAAGEVRGTLLSFDPRHVVLETGDAKYPVRLVQRGQNLRDIRLGAVDGGLVTEPTLEWKVTAARAGRHTAEVTYQTAGMSWAADYTAVLDPTRHAVDLTGWVSLTNRSGASFAGARVVLVSGGVEQATPTTTTGYVAARPDTARPRVFPLAGAVDLRDGASVQLELFPPRSGARTEEVLVYEPLANSAYYASGYPNNDCSAYTYQAVKTTSERFVEAALPADKGGALPEGTVRVYRRGAAGALELVGSDPMVASGGGAVRLRTGTSDEVKGERRQVPGSCQPDPSGRALTEKIEIKVSNGGQRAVQVVVREYMQRWTNWTVKEESQKGTRAGPVAQEYRVKLPPGASKTVSYTVTYTW
jgi:hypothetical protein